MGLEQKGSINKSPKTEHKHVLIRERIVTMLPVNSRAIFQTHARLSPSKT